MNIDNLIENLFYNRLMRNDKEIEVFEKSLDEITDLPNANYIKKLCMVFDDKTEQEDVMWGLVHLVESFDTTFGNEQALKQVINATPHMVNVANEWIKILNYRILNDKPSRVAYSKALHSAEQNIRDIVIELLNDIKENSKNEFAEYVNEVINSIK